MAITDYRTQGDENSQTHVEEPSFPPLAVVNLKREADSVRQTYKNFVLFNVNSHAIRMAVMEGEFRWHKHPHSDECFLVVEGELEIDIAQDKTYHLKAGDAFTIPAGIVHRTRSRSRAVNLCFENQGAYTDVVFEDESLWGRLSDADFHCKNCCSGSLVGLLVFPYSSWVSLTSNLALWCNG